MKRYELEDLDMTEVGCTNCEECPLSDASNCSTNPGHENSHLYEETDCMNKIIKLKAKKAKSLGGYYKQL